MDALFELLIFLVPFLAVLTLAAWVADHRMKDL